MKELDIQSPSPREQALLELSFQSGLKEKRVRNALARRLEEVQGIEMTPLGGQPAQRAMLASQRAQANA